MTDRERNFRCIVFKWPPDRYGRTQTSYRNVADQKRVLWDDSLDGDTGLRTQQRKSIKFCIGTHGFRNLFITDKAEDEFPLRKARDMAISNLPSLYDITAELNFRFQTAIEQALRKGKSPLVIFTALHIYRAVFATANVSVRLSVTRVNCDKTNESSAEILIPYER